MSESAKTRSSNTVSITLTIKIDLALLRLQKRTLVDIRAGATVTAHHEDAVEGILNLLDFVQDAIVDNGIATESEVFGTPVPAQRRRRKVGRRSSKVT